MMLGYMLARAGIRATVLEKHGDFLRDFRGDTVHPSTLQILRELGLFERFDRLPQHRIQQVNIELGDRMQPFADFGGLEPFDYIALVPQWNFLNLLASAGRAYAEFDLRMSTVADSLMEENGRVIGVRAHDRDNELEIHADLVIGCDGRHSTLRSAAGLTPVEYGAPMDVLWFRISRKSSDPPDVFGRAAYGHMIVLLNRNTYWQVAYVVPKGAADQLRQSSLEDFRANVAKLAPFLADRMKDLTAWSDLKLLEVKVNRLERWYRPGLLLIGDAAHGMSPVGGVGINLAIQDAVAAANALVPALLAKSGPPEAKVLRAVQRRREFPTRITQALQRLIQNRVISHALEQSDEPVHLPSIVRGLLHFRSMRRIPARLLGYGIRREHVRTKPATVRRA
jgi:2-polyprenyl-6-methoxyphenol hydroxylase-like FAD-dependent oxidoreductase